MARKKKELPLLEKVTITDVAAEGKAVAKVNELVIFVPRRSRFTGEAQEEPLRRSGGGKVP